MLPVPDIEKIYFDKDSEFSSNNEALLQGIKIYIDTESGVDMTSFLRWEYAETWKFQVPSPKKFDYVNETIFIPVSNVPFNCWKSNNSGTILTGSVKPGINSSLKRQAVCFIPSDKSDRLTLRYSIEVKQYSVSPKEFDYWNNLKQVSETAGDIFETQPFPVSGNIYNVTDPDDRVLGYFQVSAVKKKRLYISLAEIASFGLPAYSYNCNSFIVSPEDYPPPNPAAPALKFDDIYRMFMAAGGFTFVEPVINQTTKKLQKLVFAPVECADCGLSGVSQKPNFWTDQ
jgi:hypothetical protein